MIGSVAKSLVERATASGDGRQVIRLSDRALVKTGPIVRRREQRTLVVSRASLLEQPAEALLPELLAGRFLRSAVGLLVADLSLEDVAGFVYRVARAVALAGSDEQPRSVWRRMRASNSGVPRRFSSCSWR